MAELVHEIWETSEDEMVLHTCCMAGSLGNACRETLPSNSRLLITFVAGCHFDAMTIYNRFLGREPYSSEHDDDCHAYPEEWLEAQRSIDAPTIARLGEFTKEWFERLDAVNELERSEFGNNYIAIRTDPAASIIPFFITTGFTTGVHDTTTGKKWREPVARRYYIWIGKPYRIGEWHRSKEAC